MLKDDAEKGAFVLTIYLECYNPAGFKKPDVLVKLFDSEGDAYAYYDIVKNTSPRYFPEIEVFVRQTGDWKIEYMVIE